MPQPDERPSRDLAGSIARMLRRVLRHLTRKTALLAFLGVAISVWVLSLVGPDGPIGQVGLVAIGTLLSFTLLPDEPHRLWNVDARAMAETVPPDKLAEAGRELVGALALQSEVKIPATLLQQMWDSGLSDLRRVASNPSAVARDLDYRVVVTPRNGEVLIETDIASQRYHPGVDEVYVSFCSNIEALTHEFNAPGGGCVLRELVARRATETPSEWVARVSAYPVTIRVGGLSLPLRRVQQLSVGGGDSAIVRFIHDAGELSERFCSVRLSATFETVDTHEFAIKFSSYYCVGSTNVSFEMRDRSIEVDYNEFLSTATRGIEINAVSSPHTQRITISTDDDAVLPPGSGVVFVWHPAAQRLLTPPKHLQLDALPAGRPLPAVRPLPTARRSSAQRDEPLVEVVGVEVIDAYARLGISAPRTTRLREGVLQRLLQAQESLPEGFTLVVLDGWRSTQMQALLVDHYAAAGVGSDYVAAVDSEAMRPPHVTGGAVDLTLAWEGRPLALGTDFDAFDVSAHLDAFEATDGVPRRLRRILATAMVGAGFAPYPFEWWHWSYGDDVWAEYYGADQVLYDTIES